MDKPSRISLNGAEWLFKPFYGEDWFWRDSYKPDTRDVLGWHNGCVPGSVQHDLWRNDLVPDPYFEENSLALEWVPERSWVYKRPFYADPAWKGQRVRLVFEGVDYAARFYLNGELAGRHEGMYTCAEYDVGGLLKYGDENLIAVVIEPAPDEQPQVGYTSRVRTHKSRMTYWWDFCPRMIHLGIWDSVYLEVTGPVRIDDIYVRPELSEELDRAVLRTAVTLSALEAQEVHVLASVRLGDQEVISEEQALQLTVGQTVVEFALHVDQPQLWWPNGRGEQNLYSIEFRIDTIEIKDMGQAGRELDRAVMFTGIRHLEFIPNEGAADTARPYTLQANGRKIYIQGWNWVPLDVMYGVERPEKLERLLNLAKRAGVNLLRVWGGGLIEKEHFYDLCDRLGILVWQEFIQSSSGIDNTPTDDPGFVKFMVDQAERIVPRRRNHACLAVWCGGNELQNTEGRPLDDSHTILGALYSVVSRLDPDRAWLPTSPSGLVFGNSLAEIERDPQALHDVHGPWEFGGLEDHFTLYNRGTSLLHSEFGVEGITNQKTLDRTISPSRQEPVDLNNPVWFHLGAWWVKKPMWERVFGRVEGVRRLVKAVQYLQAAGLGYAVEANRRRAYHNSGSLPWQFNEPYPMAACTSAVDYYAQPKPVYYAVRRAYQPVQITARFPTLAWAGRDFMDFEIWAVNSRLEGIQDAQVVMQIRGASGQIYADWATDASIGANGAYHLADWQTAASSLGEEVFLLDLRLRSSGGETLALNRYAFCAGADLSPLLSVPPTTIRFQAQESGPNSSLFTLINLGSWTALFVWLEDGRPLGSEGSIYFEDNHFCLFPGESRSIAVDWQNIPPGERWIQVSGWNFEDVAWRS